MPNIISTIRTDNQKITILNFANPISVVVKFIQALFIGTGLVVVGTGGAVVRIGAAVDRTGAAAVGIGAADGIGAAAVGIGAADGIGLVKESQFNAEVLNAILLRKTSPAIKQENKVNNINIDIIANI